MLFAILFFWQFPHFFSLAWLYREDYARAGLSMLPAVEPDGRATARQIVGYSVALLAASLLPLFSQSAGAAYGISAAVMGLGILALGLFFFRDQTVPRARRLFLASVAYLPILLAILVCDGVRWGP
ncbi:MAG TPA: UbiA family prenyltransferase [Elusimicrobiota bacterium]|nr:UbiA family prenyltransferase [Elusimicrobiota bacterium]